MRFAILLFILAVSAWQPPLAAQPLPVGNPDAVARLAADVRDKGWIVFSARSPAGDWDLSACRPDGSGRRNLTRTPDVNEFSPQVNRNGRHMLYRRIPKAEVIDNNRHGTQGELVLAAADGSGAKPLGKSGELTWATWNPDGTRFATLSIKGLFIYDLQSLAEVRRLERRGFFQQVTWSPDGSNIVGVANSFGTGWSIASMDVRTGEAKPLNRVDCCTPDWFPDSQDVIFSWRPPGQKAKGGYGWTQLWRVDAQGRERQLVYGEDGRHVYGGHVSPDGKYALFTGNMEEDGDPNHAGGPMGLMRLSDAPIIGGESTELRTLHKNANNGPVLQLPDGWEPCWTSAELFRDANPGTAADAEALKPLLRAHGWLAFSDRSPAGDWDLYRTRPDGSARRSLTATPDFNEGGVRFSPEGDRILYYRMPTSVPLDNNTYGTFELMIANADGSAAVSLGKRAWACWGPDGSRMACLTPQKIQVFDPATGATVRELPRRGVVQQLTWSPDGRWFAGTANGLGPFWNVAVMDAMTGTISAISETERYNCTPDWCPDSRAVLYSRGIIPQQPGHAELWVAQRDGSAWRPVYSEPALHIYGACPSPDGRFIVFTRSRDDLGKVPEINMAVIPWPGAGETLSPAVALDLGSGWEPHWILKEL